VVKPTDEYFAVTSPLSRYPVLLLEGACVARQDSALCAITVMD